MQVLLICNHILAYCCSCALENSYVCLFLSLLLFTCVLCCCCSLHTGMASTRVLWSRALPPLAACLEAPPFITGSTPSWWKGVCSNTQHSSLCCTVPHRCDCVVLYRITVTVLYCTTSLSLCFTVYFMWR